MFVGLITKVINARTQRRLSEIVTKSFKAPFELMEYNGMERNEMKYNNVSLFGFEK